jgi:hypothetical protein
MAVTRVLSRTDAPILSCSSQYFPVLRRFVQKMSAAVNQTKRNSLGLCADKIAARPKQVPDLAVSTPEYPPPTTTKVISLRRIAFLDNAGGFQSFQHTVLRRIASPTVFINNRAQAFSARG